MPLIVEDGSGVANADALLSLAAFKAYCAAHAYSLGDPPGRENRAFDDETEVEPAIRKASVWVSQHTWKGSRTYGRAQSFALPRTGLVDAEGLTVAPDEVLSEAAAAVAEAAWFILNGGDLAPVVLLDQRTKREKVGPLETEYFDAGGAEGAVPVLTSIDRLLGPFLVQAYTGVVLGIRALG